MIDLDRVAPPPVPAPRSHSWPGALLAMALALILTGAAPVPRIGELRQVAATATASGPWLLTADTLYSTHSRTTGRFDVIAWSLATGKALWQRDVEWWAEVPVLTEAGSALVLATRDSSQKAVVLDSRTGADLVEPGTFTTAAPVGDRVLLWHQPTRRLTLYDPAAKRVAWQRPSETFVGAAVAPDDRLLVLTWSEFATLTLSSGKLIGRTARDKVWGSPVSIVGAVGESAYLLGRINLTGIRLPGRPLWTMTLPLPSDAVACGTRICVSGGAGLFAIDPETGTIAWDNHDWIGGEDGLVRTREGHVVRIDTETGTAQANLGLGLPAGDLLLRPGRGTVSLVDMRTGQIRARQPGVQPGACRRTGEHLACQQEGGQVAVWRLP
ncbi:outer membrane protein assembly factor BamB family protein [Actinoplanes italicus]|uniref:Putative pyrroloquinoline-quinone binding quinoprotein n=1 Tax=Actinoplanes italicus TaxID=113567 RepID=A0A2T0KJB8_9ACTN|nr:PQQ-binding-like beta-propeller repeat protein [Actinoplanes italicus]PRX23608.1 putative pyrroloquinoline-quinone binding quinoprotein [Actinoplanes italicus]